MEIFSRHSTSSLYHTFLPNIIQYEKYLVLVIFVIGIITNILVAIVFWYPKMRTKQSSIFTLLALSISDMICLILILLEEAEKVWEVQLFKVDMSCQIFKTLLKSSKFFSMILLLTAIIQHYLSMKNYHLFDYYKRKKWLSLLVMSQYIGIVILFIYDGYYSKLEKLAIQINECRYMKDLWNSKFYISYYWIIDFGVWSIITFSISGMSVLVHHNNKFKRDKLTNSHRSDCKLNQQKHCSCFVKDLEDQDLKLSKMMVSCGFYLVFTNIPILIMTCVKMLNNHGSVELKDDEIKEDPVWKQYFIIRGVGVIFRVIQMTQYCTRFFIYLATNTHFRIYLSEVFGSIPAQSNHKRKYKKLVRPKINQIPLNDSNIKIEMNKLQARKHRKDRKARLVGGKDTDRSRKAAYQRSRSNSGSRSNLSSKSYNTERSTNPRKSRYTARQTSNSQSPVQMRIKEANRFSRIPNGNTPIIPVYYSIPRPQSVVEPSMVRPWAQDKNEKSKYHNVSSVIEVVSSSDDEYSDDLYSYYEDEDKMKDEKYTWSGDSTDNSDGSIKDSIVKAKHQNRLQKAQRKDESQFVVYLNNCDCENIDSAKKNTNPKVNRI